VGNRVWFDGNDDARRDAGETGLSGVTLRLYSGATVVATTTTDANGRYSFDTLTPGAYTVEAEAPAGMVNSTDIASSGAPDNNNNHFDDNFGLYRPFSVGNRVWLDSNENAKHDPNEIGIGGVDVQILLPDGEAQATIQTLVAAPAAESAVALSHSDVAASPVQASAAVPVSVVAGEAPAPLASINERVVAEPAMKSAPPTADTPVQGASVAQAVAMEPQASQDAAASTDRVVAPPAPDAGPLPIQAQAAQVQAPVDAIGSVHTAPQRAAAMLHSGALLLFGAAGFGLIALCADVSPSKQSEEID
jgi:hypothetical protein